MPSTVKAQLIVGAFGMGASYNIAKLFSPSELTANTTLAGGLRAAKAVCCGRPDDRPCHAQGGLGAAALTPNEFDLLTALSMEAGRVVAYDRMLRRVWRPGMPGNQRVLRIHLMHLRRS